MKTNIAKWGVIMLLVGFISGFIIAQRIYGDFELESYLVSPTSKISITLFCTPTPTIASSSATMIPPSPTIDIQINTPASASNNAGSSASMPLAAPATGRVK
jgi:hypothetical protein